MAMAMKILFFVCASTPIKWSHFHNMKWSYFHIANLPLSQKWSNIFWNYIFILKFGSQIYRSTDYLLHIWNANKCDKCQHICLDQGGIKHLRIQPGSAGYLTALGQKYSMSTSAYMEQQTYVRHFSHFKCRLLSVLLVSLQYGILRALYLVNWGSGLNSECRDGQLVSLYVN